MGRALNLYPESGNCFASCPARGGSKCPKQATVRGGGNQKPEAWSATASPTGRGSASRPDNLCAVRSAPSLFSNHCGYAGSFWGSASSEYLIPISRYIVIAGVRSSSACPCFPVERYKPAI